MAKTVDCAGEPDAPEVPVTVPVIDQELVIHVFSPLEGPQAETAHQQLRRLWSACRGQLGMTEPIPGIVAPALPPETDAALRPDGVAAAQQSPDATRQAVLRRVDDVMNLSVALAQPAPQIMGLPSKRPLGWVECAQIWSQVSAPGSDAALGEIRLFLARAPVGGSGTVEATAVLGQSLEPLLPYREDRAREWWRWGTTTSAGYAVWDLRPGDTGSIREIVIIAASDRDDELSAWAWSDGTTDLPRFARYLLHMAKLRYEARLLDSWGRDQRRGDVNGMLAELSVALAPDAPHPGKAELLRSRLSRLRAEEVRLNALEADLEALSNTVSIARGNLDVAVGRGTGEGATDLFSADQALARWLTQQLEDYLKYLRTDLGQTRRARELAAEELDQTMQAGPAPDTAGVSPRPTSAGQAASASTEKPATSIDDVKRRVFVVHGRDTSLANRFYDLLRAVDLRPLEWESLVKATGIATPRLGEIVAAAPRLAQATLVLLSPDDIVELHSDLFLADDIPQERGRAGQARPNVLFELGLALMAYPHNTVIVEVGRMRPLSDLAGLNVIRFDGSAEAIKKVLSRLEIAGCAVDDSAVDWLDLSRFADLRTYRRGPGNHKAAP
jgi:predicted nucleotide-binding protein